VETPLCRSTNLEEIAMIMNMKAPLALVCALALTSFAHAGITVTGTGKVKYTPDIAHVSVGVSCEDTTAAGAWKKNGDLVQKLFAALRALGVADKDLQTTGVNISPRYDHPKEKAPVLVGYTATYDLSITVRKLGEIGKLLDAAVEAGANRQVGIRFACSEPEKMIDSARTAAVAEARKKAELYVTGAGARLGLVQSIAEGSYSPWREQRFEMPAKAMAGQPLPIVAGEQELTISVTLTYAIVHATSPR
jgi:uncharacterized protein YggE